MKKKERKQDRERERERCVLNLTQQHRAVLYVCGSATGMARNVHETLVKIIQEKLPSCSTADQAEQYANELAEQGRYMKDVWG